MSLTEMENYRELILENIEYDCLKQRFGTYREDIVIQSIMCYNFNVVDNDKSELLS